MQKELSADYLIIGAGIVGLTLADALRRRFPQASITILDKEESVARHGSGRNSGVLHAGFYYTADSLKARFTRDGNALMRVFCQAHSIPVNACYKVVVAKNEKELEGLFELKRRAERNDVALQLIDAQELAAIEPNARTHDYALFSPTTATVNPLQVSQALEAQLRKAGVAFYFSHPFVKRLDAHTLLAGGKRFAAGKIINCAGLYADRIAKQYGFGLPYTIIPFKGVYLKYGGSTPPARTNIYPVPNLANPFLGVHFTLTAEGMVKIGPTAIPAFWRENYRGLSGFHADELAEVLRWEAALFVRNSFGFRKLAREEMRKYWRPHLIAQAAKLVQTLDPSGFSAWSTPGIRAQLLDTRNYTLVQDFLVEGDGVSTHVLNAVSPAFTCSFAFGRWLVEEYIVSGASEGSGGGRAGASQTRAAGV